MSDILSARELRTQEALSALRGIMQHREHRTFLREGPIEIGGGSEPNDPFVLVIPLHVRAFYIWEEVLHDE